jgi:hypothetical protein
MTKGTRRDRCASQEVMSKLLELEKLLDGTSGRKVTTDEYSDVRNLLDHFEAENNRRFCEFGSLVESLQVNTLLYNSKKYRFGRKFGSGQDFGW